MREDAPLIFASGRVQQFKEQMRLPDSLAQARRLIVTIVEEDDWKEYYWPNRQGPNVVRWSSFEEFVTGPALKGGLAWSIEDLREYVRGDPVAEDAVDRATRRKAGAQPGNRNRSDGKEKTKVDNVNIRRPDGNSARQALRTLRDKRPDLHEKVLAGELSANAAMIEGGFRKKTMTVPTDVEGLAKALRKKLNKRQREKLVRLINE